MTIFFRFFFALLFYLSTAVAQSITEPVHFKVGVCNSPPYAYKDISGKWTGLTVDLWEQIARKLNYQYDYVEFEMNQVMEALHTGACDLCLSEMAPSAEAKNSIDFTEPYLASRLLVAVRSFVISQEILEFLNSLKNNGFFEVFLVMMFGLLSFSLMLWYVERKHERGHFTGELPDAVGSALWFGAVTMSTNGYGDKVPQTLLGRTITFVWMIAGMVLLAVLTGTIISAITLAAERTSFKHLSDLAHYKNGVVRGNYAARTLKSKGIPTKKFESFEEGLKALWEKKITAFVGDSISLQYLVGRDYPGRLRLASIPSGTLYRSIGLRPNLPQKREINLALLEITSPPEWNDHIEQWTGPLSFGH